MVVGLGHLSLGSTNERTNTGSKNCHEKRRRGRDFIANFTSSDSPEKLWIGGLIKEGETEYQKRKQSLTYLFREQSEELFSSHPLEKIFDCSKGHPILLKEYLSGRLSLENFVIYEKIFHFREDFDKKLTDPVWETVSLKIKKYGPFINIDVFNYKKLLRDIVNE